MTCRPFDPPPLVEGPVKVQVNWINGKARNWPYRGKTAEVHFKRHKKCRLSRASYADFIHGRLETDRELSCFGQAPQQPSMARPATRMPCRPACVDSSEHVRLAGVDA
jgi:hypothetical protein